jgi:G:T-mismatch repair DNA endonuclease (very short patch repair protein)
MKCDNWIVLKAKSEQNKIMVYSCTQKKIEGFWFANSCRTFFHWSTNNGRYWERKMQSNVEIIIGVDIDDLKYMHSHPQMILDDLTCFQIKKFGSF